MLQDLLQDRFALKVSRKTMPVGGYELIVRKGGPKLKPAVTDPAEYASASMLPADATLATTDKNGHQELRRGRKGRANIGLPGGIMRISGRIQSIADMITMCEGVMRAPVRDRTNLSGEYDFKLDFIRSPGAFPMNSESGELPGDKGLLPAEFPTALREQLGLQLVAAKIPTEVLVIDHVNRVPTEN